MKMKEVTIGTAKKLTKSKAKDLIKRELGISVTKLEAPPSMNQNSKYPWYELQTGALTIVIYTNEFVDGKMIVLHMSFNDGLGSITRYFYADTLEEAPEYSEHRYWQDILEVTDENDIAALERRHSTEARKACLAHFERRKVSS